MPREVEKTQGQHVDLVGGKNCVVRCVWQSFLPTPFPQPVQLWENWFDVRSIARALLQYDIHAFTFFLVLYLMNFEEGLASSEKFVWQPCLEI